MVWTLRAVVSLTFQRALDQKSTDSASGEGKRGGRFVPRVLACHIETSADSAGAGTSRSLSLFYEVLLKVSRHEDETHGKYSAARSVARAAKSTAAAERAIQKRVDQTERRRGKSKPGTVAIQAGTRHYPTPPLPKQHLRKPGHEADLQLAPMFDNPQYLGSEKLKNKVALVTGGDSGIGRAVAVLFAREGADVAVTYLNEDKDAKETKAAVEKEGRRCILISGDVADPAFCREAVARAVKQLGKLDVLVNNAAFQEHVTNLEALSDEHFDRTLKTNLYGYFFMARAAVPHMKPGSAIVMTGSVTGLLGNASLLDTQ